MKKRKKKNNFLVFIFILSSIYLIYNITLFNIENNIRYIIIGIIIFIDLLILFLKKIKNSILIILSIICLILSFSINKMYSLIDSINKNKIVYSSSLIALKDSNIKNIDDVTGIKIGLINDNLSIDNYVIAKEIIDKEKLDNDNEIINYEDLLIMLNDLYNKKIDAMFISSNYSTMFQNVEGYENISNEVFEITYKDKTVKKEKNIFSFKENSTLKPFSILLMGVDSTKDGLKKNSYANGDGLMVLTFNPETLNMTMMSIPRDSYVPISCKNNTEDKLTHAGWNGTECMVNTIENLFNIDINYYVKVNFKGVVSLVDNLGGVTIDVKKKLCTDDSNRSGKICINKGVQTLNGEQALVLARNRYDLANGDIDRGYNQQLLIRSLIEKMKEIDNVSTVLNILSNVSNNLDTNLSTDDIIASYNIFKDILKSNSYKKTNNVLNIIQIRLDGKSYKKYFKKLNMNLYIYELNKDSINNASNEMNNNLKTDTEMIKSFTFKP